jgi:hypothetical protein
LTCKKPDHGRSLLGHEGRPDRAEESGRTPHWPIAAVLREHLIAHQLRSGRRQGLAFGRSSHRPFEPVTLFERAGRAWKKATLEAITLHECVHTFASLMIAAGLLDHYLTRTVVSAT